MTRSCTVYSGKLILTVRVFLYKLALGMDENAPNLELKHSGLCRIGCRSRIFDICFVQKVLLHTPYTSSSLLRKATTARCYRSRGPLFPCFFSNLSDGHGRHGINVKRVQLLVKRLLLFFILFPFGDGLMCIMAGFFYHFLRIN